MSRIALRIIIHALATGALVLLVPVASLIREELSGVPPSRGISVGISVALVLGVHLIINLVMALVSNPLLKGAGIAVFIAATLYLLLPLHPVRALFLAVAGSGLSALAMLLCTRALERSRPE